MSGDLLTFGFALVKKESQVDANETRGKAMAGKLTKQEKSWILYDVGNSAFVLLATALIPVYFKTLAEPGSSVVVAWGYAETVASLLLALLMPVLGSLADLKGNKKKFFIGTVGTGAIALAALGIPSAALAWCSTMRSSWTPPPTSAMTRCHRRVTPGAISARACRSSCA